MPLGTPFAFSTSGGGGATSHAVATGKAMLGVRTHFAVILRDLRRLSTFREPVYADAQSTDRAWTS